MFIDTHLHLHEPYFDEKKLEEVIEDITKNKILTWAQSCDIPTYEVVLKRAEKSPYIFSSFGVLPWYAHEYVNNLEEIAELCKEAKMLGEIGLDEKNTRDKASIPHQLSLFEIFLREAEKNNKIMNCHFRGKERESFEIVKSYKAKKIIFHAYTGDINLMKDITDCGYYFSLGPSYNEEKLRLIPEDLLLLEIDVLPHQENFKLPSTIFTEMLNRFAQIKGTTKEEIELLNHQNVLRLISDNPIYNEMKELIE
ncbi:MAG: TatD family hydrolase [Candidatus Thorarchaeota archaeon]